MAVMLYRHQFNEWENSLRERRLKNLIKATSTGKNENENENAEELSVKNEDSNINQTSAPNNNREGRNSDYSGIGHSSGMFAAVADSSDMLLADVDRRRALKRGNVILGDSDTFSPDKIRRIRGNGGKKIHSRRRND